MIIRSICAAIATGLLILCSIGNNASAQEFTVGEAFTDYVRRTCGQLAGTSNRTGQQEDLFRRCNGALNAPDSSSGGLSSQGDILDQYLGVQNAVPQSDALNRTNRPNEFASARLGAIANQMRGGQFAGLVPQQPILLASNDPSAVSFSSGSSGLSRTGRLDGFASLGGFESEQDTTSSEVGYEVDGFWIAGGLDYSFSDTLIVGGAISFVDSSADIEGVGGLDEGGDSDSETLSFTAYGSWLATDALELNGSVSFGQSDFEMSRNISIVDKNGGGINDIDDGNFATVERTANSETEADIYQVSLGASYGIYYDNGVSLTPTANISYYNAEIDGFSETDANGLDLVFEAQEVDSTQVAIGATLARPYSRDWGVIMPYARATAIFELQDNPQSVVARYTAAVDANDNFVIRTNPSDDSALDLALGVTAQFGPAMSGFAEITTLTGLDDVEHRSLSLGLRYEF
ncbi:MAG: autotransporter outer membrane beta-barrel domain-containing protein [Pseudomonadota bacterium]